MKPSNRRIKKELKKLEDAIESSDDYIFKSMAYTVVNIVRWTTEDTDWLSPLKQVNFMVNILKQEIASKISVKYDGEMVRVVINDT